MAIKFDFYTGLRAGELLGLTWDCVNFEKILLESISRYNEIKILISERTIGQY